MPAPDDSVYRALTCGEWRKLRPCSHLAMRVFFELFYGDDSERAGVSIVRPSVLVDDLGSSKRAVVAAINELCSRGLIEYDADNAIAGRVGFIPANLPAQRNNAVGWLNSLPKRPDSFIVAQAAAFIEAEVSQRKAHGGKRSGASGKPHGEPPQDHRTTGPQVQFSTDVEDGSLTLTAPTTKKASKPKKPFVKPTVDEVREEFRAQGLPPHAAYGKGLTFWNWCEEREWKRGKSHMTRWRVAVGKWAGDWHAKNPQAQHREEPTHTPTIDGQIDPWGKR